MHSDYIIRMIEQFAQMIAQLVRTRKSGNHADALQQIQNLSQKFLDNDITFFINFSPEELVNHFKSDTEKAIICADLIYECGLIFQEQHNDYFHKLNELALNLYMVAIPQNKYFQKPEYMKKASTLIENQENLSQETKLNILEFQKRIGS